MKRILKIIAAVLGILLLVLAVAGFFAWRYANNTFLDFEEDYVERTDFKQVTVDGYTFTDRNANGTLEPYEDERLPISTRAEDALERMTPEEKIHLLKGSGIASAMGRTEPGEGINGAVGTIVPTPRLGLPTVYLSDGPAGLRISPNRPGEDRTYYATAFPIASQLAATWNPTLVERVGKAMGTEAREYGLDVILAPAINLHRHPLTGRNFEYFSEDPLLSGRMGAAIVRGIQSEGVGTSPKHFVANNQETQRNRNDARVSERALRELYLKNFEIVVAEAAPWTIMSSYNKVNGTYVSQNPRLLTEVLRGEWGFDGVVMSDWFGGRDAVTMVTAGNDLLEPGTSNQWEELTAGYADGSLSPAALDTAASRILRLVFRTHKMKGTPITNNPDLKAHAAITRQSAAEGMVLLRNDGALPLAADQKVALLGVTSYNFIAGGTGSGDVNEAYTVSLEEGLGNVGLQLEPTARARYVAHRAANEAAFTPPEAGLMAMLNPFAPPPLAYTEAEIAEIVGGADVGIYTIGRNSGEFRDRLEQDDFLLSELERGNLSRASAAFRAAGKPFIVVLNVGGVIEMASWEELADAVLIAWQGGQEGGNAAADVLTGRVNPSGKLPMTFPVRLADHAANANFPVDPTPVGVVDFLTGNQERSPDEWVRNEDYTDYEEGVFIGYRHFDRDNQAVSYPFGYGLSYTEFAFDEPVVSVSNDTVYVACTVRNVGEVAGKEVVQVYVGKEASAVERPRRELKAFGKTDVLAPGQAQTLRFAVPSADLRYWDERLGWQLEPGSYTVATGPSSRELQTNTVDLDNQGRKANE